MRKRQARHIIVFVLYYIGLFTLINLLKVPSAQAAVILTKDGCAQCTIVVGIDDGASFVHTMERSNITRFVPSEVLSAAAKDFADHLNEMGLIWNDLEKVKVVKQKEKVGTKYRILLGTAAIEEYGLEEEAASLPYPAYIYKVIGNDLLIFGSSSKGTANGVYGFMQDELGIRWFGPQENFRILPTKAAIEIPELSKKVVPSFFSRRSVEERIEFPTYLWGRRMRMPEAIDDQQPFINVSHNLHKIFPPSLYFENHPEYYALRRWKRQIDEPKSWNWSLCWSNPDIVGIAANAAKAFFKANRNNHTFSLGINDTNAFCECVECTNIQPKGTFRGMRIASDMYFHFVNEVAKAVKQEFPDRFIGTIAYNDVTLPPSFPLGKNVHVVIVTDISEYFNLKHRAQDDEIIHAWQEKKISLGLYYYLGLAKLVPAYFPHLLSEVLQNAYRSGFTSIYSETYPGWPWTGPMAYLEAQLLWDSERNPDHVLQDYFHKLFGAAAKPMSDLYDLLEQIYMRPRSGGFLREHYKLLQFRPYNRDDLKAIRGHLLQAHQSFQDVGTGYTGRDGKEAQRLAYVSNGLKVFIDMLEGKLSADEINFIRYNDLSDIDAMDKLDAIWRIDAILKRHRALYRETILSDKSQSRRYSWDTCRPLREEWSSYLSSSVKKGISELLKWSRSNQANPLVTQKITAAAKVLH